MRNRKKFLPDPAEVGPTVLIYVVLFTGLTAEHKAVLLEEEAGLLVVVKAVTSKKIQVRKQAGAIIIIIKIITIKHNTI